MHLKGNFALWKYSISFECQPPLPNIRIHHKEGACSKPVLSPSTPLRTGLAEGRPVISPAHTQGRQDAPIHGQGRRGFGAPGAYTEYVRANGGRGPSL